MADTSAPAADKPTEAPAAAPAATAAVTESVAAHAVTAPVVAAAESKSEAPAEKAADEPSAPAPAPEAPTASPFDQLAAKLVEIVKEVAHDEMWGVVLAAASAEAAAADVPTSIVVQKFLNANDGNVATAAEQFAAALKFRKERKPLELLAKTFNAGKFGDLGAVTYYPVEGSAVPEVFTWNLYGNVKDRIDEVFVPLDDFMEFRIALQELGLKHLNLAGAKERITEAEDPYKIIQVHDYKNISFLRQSPNVKAASTEVIKQFSTAYPELLKEKFFVNVPLFMGWVYGIMKLFVAAKTLKKFHPMNNGVNLANEFKGSGLDVKALPKEYGGEAGTGDGTLKNLGGGQDTLKFA